MERLEAVQIKWLEVALELHHQARRWKDKEKCEHLTFTANCLEVAAMDLDPDQP